MFSFYFGKKIKWGVSIVFDISTDSVSAAIIHLSEDEKPRILCSFKEQIPIQEKADSKKLTFLMFLGLKKVCELLQKEGLTHLNFTKYKLKQIREVAIVFSSLWQHSQTKIIKINEKESFKLTESDIQQILKDEQIKFIEEISKIKNIPKNNIRILESKITQIKLNGYETADPFNKLVNSAEFSIFLSLIENNIMEDVKKTISTYFYVDFFNSHSSTLIFYSVLRDIYSHTENSEHIYGGDFQIIDVDGEITEVSLVKNGTLYETDTFPYGKNLVYRLINTKSKNHAVLCSSLLSLYYQNKINKDEGVNLKTYLDEACEKWTNFLTESFEEFSKNVYLPSNVYLLAPSDVSQFFFDCSEKVLKEISTLKMINFSVNFLKQNNLKQYCFFNEKEKIDARIIMITIYLSKIFLFNEKDYN